jgi:hypothetical protein
MKPSIPWDVSRLWYPFIIKQSNSFIIKQPNAFIIKQPNSCNEQSCFVLPSVGGIDSDMFGSILLMLDLRQCSIFSLKIEHRRRSSISSIDLHISESIPPTLGRMKIARYNISQLVPESSLCTTLVPRSRMRYPSHSS